MDKWTTGLADLRTIRAGLRLAKDWKRIRQYSATYFAASENGPIN